MDLKENYIDDILDTSKNTKRKYNMITNADGTVSFEDVTEYVQQGDTFGAAEVNQITEKVNSCLTPQDLSCSINTTDWTENSSYAEKCGRIVRVELRLVGAPTKNKVIMSGLPTPTHIIYQYDGTTTPSMLMIYRDGTLSVVSSGTANSVSIRCIIVYFTND